MRVATTSGNGCRKRGRPRDPLLEHRRAMQKLCPADAKSRRGIDDHCYAQHAIGALYRSGRSFGWLFDAPTWEAGATARNPHNTVLAELGRLRHEGWIVATAARLLEVFPSRPNIRRACELVRACRTILEDAEQGVARVDLRGAERLLLGLYSGSLAGVGLLARLSAGILRQPRADLPDSPARAHPDLGEPQVVSSGLPASPRAASTRPSSRSTSPSSGLRDEGDVPAVKATIDEARP